MGRRKHVDIRSLGIKGCPRIEDRRSECENAECQGLGNSGEDMTWTPTSCIGVLAEFFVLLLKNIFINLCCGLYSC